MDNDATFIKFQLTSPVLLLSFYIPVFLIEKTHKSPILSRHASSWLRSPETAILYIFRFASLYIFYVSINLVQREKKKFLSDSKINPHPT